MFCFVQHFGTAVSELQKKKNAEYYSNKYHFYEIRKFAKTLLWAWFFGQVLLIPVATFLKNVYSVQWEIAKQEIRSNWRFLMC